MGRAGVLGGARGAAADVSGVGAVARRSPGVGDCGMGRSGAAVDGRVSDVREDVPWPEIDGVRGGIDEERPCSARAARRWPMSVRAPTVSVLLPVHNGGEFLRPTVDSVLAQTMADFEIVLVDDGSKDGCVDELAALREPRIVVLRQ